MSKEKDTDSRIHVVGATTREETVHIEKCLIDWDYEIIPLNGEKTGTIAPIPKSTSLILVYAQDEPKNTIAICEQIRKDHTGMTAPILLAIDRYKMSPFYELRRRMDNITTIKTPFSKEEITAKITENIGAA